MTSRARKPIPRLSEKRRASLGKGKVWSTIKKKPRKKQDFARIYGSKERVEFVKSLPCAACGVVGYSENAHVLGNGGLSRKAGYETIAPLCGYREAAVLPRSWEVRFGCHGTYDKMRWAFDRAFPDFDAEKACAETQRLWMETR